MLKKNIYITYPAGYMGTYINWLISVSDVDLSKTTTKSPLTSNKNAHEHIKYPTHLSLSKLLVWLIKNKPQHPLIYAINTRMDKDYHLTTEFAMQHIMRFDSDPVFINCHDNSEDDIIKYGAINMFRKWPTFISAIGVWHGDYNPALDDDIIHARNWLLENWKLLNPGNSPVNPDIIMYNLKGHRDWFNVRKQTAPLEITEEQYLIPSEMPSHLLEFNIKDILKNDFILVLEEKLKSIEVADLDFSYAHEYHKTFIDSQSDYSRWFESIENLRNNRVVDEWFYSDAISQAFLLLEFDKDSYKDILDKPTKEIIQKLF